MRHRPTRLSTALDPLFLGCLDAVRTFLYATRIDRDTSHHAISALPPLYRRDYASLAGLGGYLLHYFVLCENSLSTFLQWRMTAIASSGLFTMPSVWK